MLPGGTITVFVDPGAEGAISILLPGGTVTVVVEPGALAGGLTAFGLKEGGEVCAIPPGTRPTHRKATLAIAAVILEGFVFMFISSMLALCENKQI